jgi:hypothetical protein
MARLIYSAIMSRDGDTADADGRFEWAAPEEEVHAFVNELERPVGTYLYGRRHPGPARPGPPEPDPGAGAQVRQRHRLPLLPPGVGSACRTAGARHTKALR